MELVQRRRPTARRGRAAILAGHDPEIQPEYAVDEDGVFVAGLSAGGAMAAIMAVAYPELYSRRRSAFRPCLWFRNRCRDSDDGHDDRWVSGTKGAALPLIVFHGDSDSIVAVANAESLVTANPFRVGDAEQEGRPHGQHQYPNRGRRGHARTPGRCTRTPKAGSSSRPGSCTAVAMPGSAAAPAPLHGPAAGASGRSCVLAGNGRGLLTSSVLTRHGSPAPRRRLSCDSRPRGDTLVWSGQPFGCFRIGQLCPMTCRRRWSAPPGVG